MGNPPTPEEIEKSVQEILGKIGKKLRPGISESEFLFGFQALAEERQKNAWIDFWSLDI